MSFGEGNLRTAVRDLTDEIGQLRAGNAELERLVANRDESIRNLVKVLDKRQGRIHALETLVCDLYSYLESDYTPGYYEPFKERMRALGIEVDR